MAISFLAYVATFIFGEATSSHFFRVITSKQQLFFGAAVYSEQVLFWRVPFSEQSIFCSSYFFRIADF